MTRPRSLVLLIALALAGCTRDSEEDGGRPVGPGPGDAAQDAAQGDGSGADAGAQSDGSQPDANPGVQQDAAMDATVDGSTADASPDANDASDDSSVEGDPAVCAGCTRALMPAVCGAAYPVQWECLAGAPHASVSAECVDQFTGVLRYCCAESFASHCP